MLKSRAAASAVQFGSDNYVCGDINSLEGTIADCATLHNSDRLHISLQPTLIYNRLRILFQSMYNRLHISFRIQQTAQRNIQQPTKVRRLHISAVPVFQGQQTAYLYSSQQGPLRAGRLRISTSALQAPLRAAYCSSLLQPIKVR